jgi:hypothetical protein
MLLMPNEHPLFRPQIRDMYCHKFNKDNALEYMAIADYDLGFMILGRIEVIENFAFNLWSMPNAFVFKSEEERKYYNWIREIMNRISARIDGKHGDINE